MTDQDDMTLKFEHLAKMWERLPVHQPRPDVEEVYRALAYIGGCSVAEVRKQVYERWIQ